MGAVTESANPPSVIAAPSALPAEYLLLVARQEQRQDERRSVSSGRTLRHAAAPSGQPAASGWQTSALVACGRACRDGGRRGALALPRRLVLRALRLPQGLGPFLPAQQPGGLGGLDRSAGGNRYRDAGGRRVIGCIDDDECVIVVERIAAQQDLDAHGLEPWPDCLDPVVRLFDLGGQRLRGVGGLVHVQCHRKISLAQDWPR